MSRLVDSIILLSGWRRSLLAIAAGAFAVLGQAPYDFFAACFISFPVLVWLIDGAASSQRPGLLGRFKPSFATGYWFGFGYFLAGLWWIGGALLVEGDTFAWALPFAVLGLPLVLAIFHGLAAALARLFWSDGVGKIAALAFGFGVAEWLRGFVLTGFPWNAVGYVAMPVPIAMQSVTLVSMVGMNALAVFVFSAPALLFQRRGRVIALVTAALISAAHLGFGFWRLSQPEPDAIAQIAVRIVQPNVDLSEKWDPTIRERIMKSLLDLSSQPPAAGQQKPALIVWPETSVPYIFSENPGALSAIGEMLQDGQTLVAGAVREEGSGNDARYYNSVLQIDANGEIVDAVDKVHLVPFGEYLPFDEIFARLGIRQLVSGPTNFIPGTKRHALQVGSGAKALPFICYEVIFPDLVQSEEDENLLVNVTNDAWFGNTPGPIQHLRQAQIRAVEVGKPMVRAANTGVSAVIEPSGNVTDGLAIGVKGVVDATVPLHAATVWKPPYDPTMVGYGLLLLLALWAFTARFTLFSF